MIINDNHSKLTAVNRKPAPATQLEWLTHRHTMEGIACIKGAKVLARLESKHGIRRELLLRLGSREIIDGWFERNRGWSKGSSAENRKTGARPVSKDWKWLYNLRTLSP